MYDGQKIRFAEAFLSLSNIATTQMDTCILPGLGVVKTVSCPAGLSIDSIRIHPAIAGPGLDDGTLYFLLKLMSYYKNPHVSLETSNGRGFVWAWRDGIPVVIDVSTSNLPMDFFNK